MCRLLPCPHGLPQTRAGSASASYLSRPAQTSLTLRPAGSLNRPRRPLSRGSDPTSYPARSLVSYQINRQLSEWNLPPLMIHAFGAHPSFPRSSLTQLSGGWVRPSHQASVAPSLLFFRFVVRVPERSASIAGRPICRDFSFWSAVHCDARALTLIFTPFAQSICSVKASERGTAIGREASRSARRSGARHRRMPGAGRSRVACRS